MGAPTPYIRDIRERVQDWLLWTRGTSGVVSNEAPEPFGGEFTPTGFSVNADDVAGRLLVLSDTEDGENDGEYVVAGTDGTALRFADAFPGGAESGVAYALQTSVAKRTKTFYWFAEGGAIPQGSEMVVKCPILIAFPMESNSESQANSGQTELIYRLKFRLMTAGRALGDIEDYYTLVRDRLHHGRDTRFGGMAADNGFNWMRFTSAQFELMQFADSQKNPTASGMFYECNFAVDLGIRRTAQAFI